MSNAYTDSTCGCGEETCMVSLSKTEISNIIDFIEIEFIDAVRRDPEIDNIEYVVSMMNALQKMRFAHDCLSKEEAQND